jgi:hypothetical protein
MTKCWFCGGEMGWENDSEIVDYGYEGDGIVAHLTCGNCPTDAYFVHKLGEEEDE